MLMVCLGENDRPGRESSKKEGGSIRKEKRWSAEDEGTNERQRGGPARGERKERE